MVARAVLTLEEGVYSLRNRANGQVLDLSNGDWEYGQVQTWERNDSVRGSDGQYNQTWILANVPGTQDYQIINAHYGVLAGCFAGERNGNWLVKTSPVSASSSCSRWRPEDAGDGYVRFVWGTDSSRCLDISGARSHGPAIVWPIGLASQNQMWELNRDDDLDRPYNPWGQWMSFVPDDVRLSMLNIPGTHQTLALHAVYVESPHCQNRHPYEQLCEGIRYFDLRFDRWTGAQEPWNLYARHGPSNMGYSCAAVLQALKVFLQNYPQEVVIISVTNETGTDGFQDSWQNDFVWFQDLFFTGGTTTRPRMADLTLGQVRGKVICPQMVWQNGPNWRG